MDASYSLNRKCSICNSPITDGNLDGIGCTCRQVWEKATNMAFYHFCGLNVWIARTKYWAKLYVDTCKNVKFRSKFRKSFSETIKKMVAEDNIRLSKRMLSIIIDYLVGDELDLVMGNAYPKLIGDDNIAARDNDRQIVNNLKTKWINNMSNDEINWVNNLAKKFYNEGKKS